MNYFYLLALSICAGRLALAVSLLSGECLSHHRIDHGLNPMNFLAFDRL